MFENIQNKTEEKKLFSSKYNSKTAAPYKKAYVTSRALPILTKNKKNYHGSVPTQGYKNKIKHKIKKITYQWGSTGYNKKYVKAKNCV